MADRAAIVWFRQDLRLADNRALAAGDQFGGVIPVYIQDPKREGAWAPGAASRWWLHQSLERLAEALERKGARLILRQGETDQELEKLVEETGAEAVFWNRRYEPAAVAADERTQMMLEKRGLRVETFNGALLNEPWAVETHQGGPYKVFTPFWKACREAGDPPVPLDAPHKLKQPPKWPEGVKLDRFELLPKVNWAGGLREAWTPGEAGAQARMKDFFEETIGEYAEGRDRPDQAGTSRLSPHLHFGEIGPRQLWHGAQALDRRRSGYSESVPAWVRQLYWREFGYHLIHHFPQTPEAPLHEKFKDFTWEENEAHLQAWQRGETGYPIVDAGMRELWETGWMHNRVRMIVASFLIKDLRQPWQAGEAWFWDTLVDADLANNTLGWQWVAGCGADAAPFFRIFNPVTQGKKFDPAGAYVRRWVPEIAELADKSIHAPWEAGEGVLKEAGVRLGKTYPKPMVDHGEARVRALEAYHRIK